MANSKEDQEIRIRVVEAPAQVSYVKDHKPSGTDGGDFNSGSYLPRDLNTLTGNASFISINGTDQFTLQPGVYAISGSAPALGVNRHKCKLANITDPANSIIGMSMFTSPASGVFNVSEFIIVVMLNIVVSYNFKTMFKGHENSF